MRRRAFIGTLSTLALVWKDAACAQDVFVVGFLSGRSRGETGHLLSQFQRGLAEAGYSEGRNVRFEYQFADGDYARLPALARELVGQKVAVIATAGGNVAAVAAKAATQSIPIVFAGGGDPIKTGLVESLARPGGNVTGVSLFIAELGSKRLDLLRELAPSATKFGVLVNPNNPAGLLEGREVQARAAALGLEMDILHAGAIADLEAVFAAINAQAIQALVVANDAFLVDLRAVLVALANERRVPAVYFSRDFAESGGLLSYGASIADAYHKLGMIAGQLLKGAKPADIPVQQPTAFELVLNLRTAKALGLSVLLTLQAQADEVIE